MSRRYILVVEHTDGCDCFQRARRSGAPEPVSAHDFLGPLARERYRVHYTDPACSTHAIDRDADPLIIGDILAALVAPVPA